MFTPPPSLPIELIEQILSLTFPSNPSTPFYPPTPLPSTSHLLLVSTGFSLLVSPFFYRSITIRRPQDWIAFFHPERGIFIVGNRAEERRSFDQELNIDDAEPATLPLLFVFERGSPSPTSSTYAYSTAQPSLLHSGGILAPRPSQRSSNDLAFELSSPSSPPLPALKPSPSPSTSPSRQIYTVIGQRTWFQRRPRPSSTRTRGSARSIQPGASSSLRRLREGR